MTDGLPVYGCLLKGMIFVDYSSMDKRVLMRDFMDRGQKRPPLLLLFSLIELACLV